MAKLNNDPDFRARTEQAKADRQALREKLRVAERPLVEELQAAAIEVETAWDLYKFSALGETAYPILVKHLLLDYPERVLAGIARAFTKDVARRHWPQLLEIYRTQSKGEAQDGLAATLSGCATRAHYDDLLSVLADETLGQTRIYFLRPVNRIGNRGVAGAGRAVIERLANDPILGVESTRILQGKGRND